MAKMFGEASARGRAFIQGDEGNIPYVYDDAVFPTRRYKRGETVRGTLTAGVGHIGPDLGDYIGKTSIPESVRTRWLDEDLDEAERAIADLVKVTLSETQRDALISFVFNVGTGAFRKSTLLRKLNAGAFAAVPHELQRWTKTTINGRKVTSKGLVRRRAHEVALWLGSAAVPTHDKDVPGGTQVAEREPTPTKPGEVMGWVGTIFGGLSAFAASEGPVAWAFFILAILAAIGGLSWFVKRQFFSR